ncbi:hypothetical protein MPTK1_6g04210 [Marchantia polymorpha subsp. ruderalis]|uniref:Uncharacterized protein n=2 Tax=Marchantia polymorpha TaxID=3197 RepID=A0AAF6BNE0_MARPO|nr:hypothetical protein MARPO_0034s0098 [Marchantia polymorpha]BBN13524.1 hypothetical protein Mp_6g04210 [Marchantia polymorpha subsp. ruderalis]|eukprot:PTQ41516.1 hypothetical protein MARPO_0034s0098 [Marchantia polymorpha]
MSITRAPLAAFLCNVSPRPMKNIDLVQPRLRQRQPQPQRQQRAGLQTPGGSAFLPRGVGESRLEHDSRSPVAGCRWREGSECRWTEERGLSTRQPGDASRPAGRMCQRPAQHGACAGLGRERERGILDVREGGQRDRKAVDPL